MGTPRYPDYTLPGGRRINTGRSPGSLSELLEAAFWNPRLAYLESQVAQNNRPLYLKVAHNWLKVVHHSRPLAFQVDSKPFLADRHALLSLRGLSFDELFTANLVSWIGHAGPELVQVAA